MTRREEGTGSLAEVEYLGVEGDGALTALVGQVLEQVAVTDCLVPLLVHPPDQVDPVVQLAGHVLTLQGLPHHHH